MIDRIPPADLLVLQRAQHAAEKALLEREVVNMKAFIRYGLSESDSFDVNTGIITRATAAPAAEPPTEG